MEEIEVVIKIPKILYDQIQSDAEIMIYSGMRSWKGILTTLLRSVRNGTPLPKGHGRLIDEEQIPGDGGWDFSDRLMSTPTIIEADKEGANDTDK